MKTLLAVISLLISATHLLATWRARERIFSDAGAPSVVTPVIRARVQAGADACAKIVTAMNALPSSGGVVDARGFHGAETCGGVTTLSKSSVAYLFGADVIFVGTAGATLTISGSDVTLTGAGISTLFDFSTGIGVNPAFRVTGSRVTIQDLKIIGNRVAGGSSDGIQVNSADVVTLRNITITNTGGNEIIANNVSNFEVANCTLSSSNFSGVFINPVSNGISIHDNTVRDTNLSSTVGHGGIMTNGPRITDVQNVSIVNNTVTQTTAGNGHVGIGANGATGLLIRGNHVKGNGGSGEAIAFTASKARVIGNQATSSGSSGILFFATTGFASDFLISNNIVFSSTPGIDIQWGSNNLSVHDGAITNNRVFGSNVGFQTQNGGSFSAPEARNIQVSGNICKGNTSAIDLQIGKDTISVFGNTRQF